MRSSRKLGVILFPQGSHACSVIFAFSFSIVLSFPTIHRFCLFTSCLNTRPWALLTHTYTQQAFLRALLGRCHSSGHCPLPSWQCTTLWFVTPRPGTPLPLLVADSFPGVHGHCILGSGPLPAGHPALCYSAWEAIFFFQFLLC
jgi:hypothetical protein